jgi:hypothetical protein
MPIALLEAKIADIDQRSIWAETSLSEAKSDVATGWLAEISGLMAERAQGHAALSRCSIWVAQGRIDAAAVISSQS